MIKGYWTISNLRRGNLQARGVQTDAQREPQSLQTQPDGMSALVRTSVLIMMKQIFTQTCSDRFVRNVEDTMYQLLSEKNHHYLNLCPTRSCAHVSNAFLCSGAR